jgi:DedD protein
MESRAKQRLTGAVILVALVVLLVPSLLTGPSDSQAPGEDAQTDGMRQYTIDMNEQNRSAQPNSVTAEPEVASTSKSAPPALAVPGEAAAPAPQVIAPANPMSANTPVQTAPAPEPAPVSPPAATPRTAPPPVATGQRGNFAVQLGTFANRENADKLVRDMTAKGFAAFVVPTTSSRGELYRVRVGPARDRAAAEALAAQLKRVGQPSSVVPIS